MEYLDFSSVITTIRKYISDAHNINWNNNMLPCLNRKRQIRHSSL